MVEFEDLTPVEIWQLMKENGRQLGEAQNRRQRLLDYVYGAPDLLLQVMEASRDNKPDEGTK